MMRQWIWSAAIAGVCFLALSVPSTAQKKSAEVTEEQKSAIRLERMQRLVTAQDLVAQGHKQYAPELLIAGASMLRALADIPELNNAGKSEVQPEIKGDGKAELDKETPPLSLLEQSDAAFKEASAMAADLGVNVDKLIDLAKTRKVKEERAVVGGPKQVSRSIGGGQTHSYTFKIYTTAPLPWSYRSDIPLRISIVRDDDFNSYYNNVTMHAAHTFHPGSSKTKQAPITIRVTNTTKKAAKYQFMFQ